jgi:hypothetical protein
MKKLIILIIVIGLNGLSYPSLSQGSKNFSEFIENTSDVLKVADEKATIVRVEYDMIYSTSHTSSRTLYAENKYFIFGYGEHVEDLDLAVYEYVDDKWVRVASDKDEEASASVTVAPSKSGLYKIELSVYKYKENKENSKYYLIIALLE